MVSSVGWYLVCSGLERAVAAGPTSLDPGQPLSPISVNEFPAPATAAQCSEGGGRRRYRSYIVGYGLVSVMLERHTQKQRPDAPDRELADFFRRPLPAAHLSAGVA